MRKFIFLAHDPGGYDAIYPVALQLSRCEKMDVAVYLSGPAGDKLPLLKKSDYYILNKIEECILAGDKFVLVTGTSWGAKIELKALELCKANGIPTISILDYWSNYAERFEYDGKYVFPDYYFLMDELAFREAVENGVDSKIIHIVGNPGLDQYVKDNKPRRILFLSQPLSVLYGENNDGYTEFEAFEGVINAAEELGLEVFIKFHPKESNDMAKKYAKYSVEGEIEKIADEFDILIGMCTMGLLQLTLMGYNVISYQPNLKKEDRCITNKLGITKGAYTYNELVRQLKTLSRDLHVIGKLPFWYDGQSTERCVNEILKISQDFYLQNKV